MGKIRVHELAKELGKTPGDVIDVLISMGMADVKSTSGIDENVAASVRSRLSEPKKQGAGAAGREKAPASEAASGKEAGGKTNPTEEAAPKKKKFVAVFRRENARSGVISRMPTKQAQARSNAASQSARAAKKRPGDMTADPSKRPVRPAEGQASAVSQAVRPEASLAAASGPSQAKSAPVEPVKQAPESTQAKSAQTEAQKTVLAVNAAPAAAVSPAAKDAEPSVNTVSAEPKSENVKPASPAGPDTSQASASAASASPNTAAQTAKGGVNRPQQQRTDSSRQDSSRPSGMQGSRGRNQSDRRSSQGQGSSQQKKPFQERTERTPRQDNRSSDSRRPYQQDRPQRGQGGQKNQGGGFAQRGPEPVSVKPGASAGGRNSSRGGSSRNGKFDQNRENTQNRSRGANARREGKDRNEKYNRFDANDRVQSGRRKKDPNRAGAFHKPEPVQVVEEQIKTIVLPDSITLKDLADKMKIQASAIIKKLFMAGKMVTVNQDLTYEEAEEIAVDYDILCEHEEKKDVIADLLREEDENEENMVPRPPVVCVMGHVDHGKTSLLDAIRDTHVTDRESGGITQHIGASVIHYNDRTITFLDTPGHEAFTAMRMRGANSTDIAVLVVAADDGVMPQTVEAINHAKAAGIEIIVAINKIDKPSANIDRVKQELTEFELISEDWGGSTTMVPVSAKSHEGIDNLLEMILLTADVMELKSNPDRRARGLVIEAKLDKGRGPVASLLVQKGTLHVGDPIDAGACFGKVRAMTDDKGRRVKEAGPSMPVEVIGFSDVPGAGEIFTSPETEKEAKSFAATFVTVGKEKMIEESRKRTSLDDLFNQIQEGTLKDLNLIVKADVQGSVEALRQSLLKLTNEEVIVKIIHSAVGAINESDVTLAGASNAIIIGFNVRPDAQAKSTAEHEGVDIRLYKVIYDAINDVENAMKGMLEPIYEEKITGHVEIRQIFKASGVGNIAGSYVLDGTVQRGSKARITRDGKLIFEGSISSLKRFKDDVKEVRSGFECGLVFDGFDEIREGDQVEAYIMVEVPRT